MGSVAYVHLRSGAAPPHLDSTFPFKVVILVEEAVTDEWRAHVSDWLVASGCLYMMAWGIDCSAWDDSVDWASLAKFDRKENPDALVMTTWHDGEPMEEVFWFCEHDAMHPTVSIEQTIVLDIALAERRDIILRAFEHANDPENQ